MEQGKVDTSALCTLTLYPLLQEEDRAVKNKLSTDDEDSAVNHALISDLIIVRSPTVV